MPPSENSIAVNNNNNNNNNNVGYMHSGGGECVGKGLDVFWKEPLL
jgi:hypothetical protein